MGKIQCVSQGRNAATWELVERSLKNANTPLEKKIHDEYYNLKNAYKETSSAVNRKKLETFIKWYKMCHCDRNGNVVWDNHSLVRKDTGSGKKLNGLGRDSVTSGMENLDVENLSKWRNLSSIDAESNCNSISISSISSCQFNFENYYEVNLRNFVERSKGRFADSMMKGVPDSFRWLSWVVASDMPSDRSREVYMNYYLEKLDEPTDTQIKKDLNRTLVEILSTEINFDDRGLQDNNDPAHNYLYRVLRAYSNLDKEVAYCQGMNFIVGFLLMVSDFNEIDTFYMLIALFSHTYNDKFCIRGFFSENFPFLHCYSYIFNHFLKDKVPNLKKHFQKLELPDEVWISKWIQTLYTICLPYEASLRLWDCLMNNGIEFIISFSIAFVKHFEDDLLSLEDSFDVIDYFKKAFQGKGQNINIEEIISNAKKLDISKSEINHVKKDYQKIFKVDLSLDQKVYDIKIHSKKSLFFENVRSTTLSHTKTVNSSATCENAFVICKEQCKYEVNVDIKKENDLDLDDDCADIYVDDPEEEDVINHKMYNYTLTPRLHDKK